MIIIIIEDGGEKRTYFLIASYQTFRNTMWEKKNVKGGTLKGNTLKAESVRKKIYIYNEKTKQRTKEFLSSKKKKF